MNRNNSLNSFAICAVWILISVNSNAQTFTIDISNTGVINDNDHGTGATLDSIGNIDAHYSLLSGPAGTSALIQAPAYWIGATADAQWIGVTASGEDFLPPGEYVYHTSFTLPAFTDLSSVVLSGRISSDNAASFIVNGGAPVPVTGDVGFDAYYPFTVTGIDVGFGLGINSLNISVINTNPGVGGNGPTGLLLEIQGSYSAVPEPAEYTVAAGLAMIAFGVWRRSRRSRVDLL